ncbi:pirin family protein [Orrella sp. 11846]|uniref:pirin family protein n=1 Tax=Orrella sp. 11846 TaxID=3409913 RepID=UPI003B5CEBBB
MNTKTFRSIEQIVQGIPTTDGAGVRLTRVLTQDLQKRLDPFLMMDAFRSDDPDDYIAGFPNHPHRGFETITYMLAGQMQHLDSGGNEGLLGPGDVQWMIAGSGLIHSELPRQKDGLMEGFQIWLNLPAKDKMIDPAYRDIAANEIPTVTTEQDVHIKIIAGQSQGQEGAMQRPVTDPLILDIHLPAGTSFEQVLGDRATAFLYVYQGQAVIQGQTVPTHHMGILSQTPDADVRIEAESATRLLLIAGQPLEESIAQYGPFVMNTTAQLEQTLLDYQQGRLVQPVARF